MVQLCRVPPPSLRAPPALPYPKVTEPGFFSGAFIGPDQLHDPRGLRPREGEQRGGEGGGSLASATGRGRGEQDGLPGGGTGGCLLRFPEPPSLSSLGSCSVTVVGTAAFAPRHSKPEPGTAKCSSPALPPREGRRVKELLGSGPPRRWSSFSSLCRASARGGGRGSFWLSPDLQGLRAGCGRQPHRAVPHPTRWSLVPPGGGKNHSRE